MLGGGIEFEFDRVLLTPGAFLVIAADPDVLTTRFGVDNVLGPFTGELRDSGDVLTLFDSERNLVDICLYDDRHPCPLAADEFGVSLEVVDPSKDNFTAANWRASSVAFPDVAADPPIGDMVGAGTPGGENSAAADGLAPFVENLTHSPVEPTSRDDVRISARVSAEAPLTSVKVVFTFGAETEEFRTAMFDDGQHDDGGAGDGIYVGVVPAQTSQTFVHYRVHATDASGRETIFPYDTEPSPTQAYFHYDGEIETPLPIYFLFLSRPAHNELMQRPSLDRYVRGNVAIEGIAYPNVGVRIGGRISRNDVRLQWKFRFNRGSLYKRNRVLDTRLLAPLNQWYAFEMFERVGLPTLEHELVRVYVNGRFSAVHVVYETPNATWARKHDFGAATEIYKARSIETPEESFNSDLFQNRIITDRDYWGVWNKKIRPLEPPDDIRELTQALNGLSDEELHPWLDRNVNVDEWMTHWIVNCLLIIDDFTGHYYYLVRPGSPDGKWAMLMHFPYSLARKNSRSPLPLYYGDGNRGSPGWQRNKFYQRVSRSGKLRRIYELKVREILLNRWDIDEISEYYKTSFNEVSREPGLSSAATHRDDIARRLIEQRDSYALTVLREGRLPSPEEVPRIVPPGAARNEPVNVSLSVPEGWVAVFTLDGSDPRLSGTSEIFEEPIALVEPTKVRAAGLFVGDEEVDLSSHKWTDVAEADFDIAFGQLGSFLRGDCDGDGAVRGTTSDAIVLLGFAFGGGNEPPCVAACDAEANGSIGVPDAIRVLRHAFLGIGQPDSPFPECAFGTLAVRRRFRLRDSDSSLSLSRADSPQGAAHSAEECRERPELVSVDRGNGKRLLSSTLPRFACRLCQVIMASRRSLW